MYRFSSVCFNLVNRCKKKTSTYTYTKHTTKKLRDLLNFKYLDQISHKHKVCIKMKFLFASFGSVLRHLTENLNRILEKDS